MADIECFDCLSKHRAQPDGQSSGVRTDFDTSWWGTRRYASINARVATTGSPLELECLGGAAPMEFPRSLQMPILTTRL